MRSNGSRQRADPVGNLPAEFNAEKHVRGVCSMARSQNPNSANSQFFICFDDARFLDKQYTVWGQVESGMEHVDALPKGEPPREPGKIVIVESGTGQVGTLLARKFRADGHEAVTLNRSQRDWPAAIDGSDVVINLAGRSVNCRYNKKNRDEILDSRVSSVRTVGLPGMCLPRWRAR